MNSTETKKHSPKTFQASGVRLNKVSQSVTQIANGDVLSYPETVKRIGCLLLVKGGKVACSSAERVNELLPSEYSDRWVRSHFALWKITGGHKVLVKLLVQGNVIPSGALGRWTPDFLSGLVMSGAMKRTKRLHSWFTSSLGERPVLRNLLVGGRGPYGSLPFSCSSTEAPANGDCLFLSGAWAFSLGADHPGGVGVLAGMIAGGRRVVYKGYSWVGISGRDSNVELLNSYSIPFERAKFGSQSWGTLLVSPFWGALLSVEMPEPLGEWFECWEQSRKVRPGMFPLLPWAFLRAAWGTGTCFTLPKGMVPFLIDRNSLREIYGIGMSQVREKSFEKFRFMRVDPRLREVWVRRMVAMGLTCEQFSLYKVPSGLSDLSNDLVDKS
jgi:hypothetical protein